ncbi:FtsK/SpoIIIE family DNA translocase [Caproiciproducens galactitolivorans]|uniref:DNA translocase FtsK 4TM domain-containing protein n=1 Tax=Caproiciproducens galactitolivorans TaxID=642589 RepID=A0ABT4BXA2_9FIRM|nr:DNA translocase FtsK [Caproiciproducens galactitolivorans]MCY1714566.1 DNA translocase FtsK 4TM domain-containing protein [Caproiciproducens galactitolivorans]
MANQKHSVKKKAPARTSRAPKAQHMAKNAGKKPERDAEYVRQRNQINAIVLFAVAILMVCLVLISGDHIWLWCHNALLGLFGSCAIIWPILLFYISIVTAFERQNNWLGGKVVLMVVIITLFCSAVYIFSAADKTSVHSLQSQLVNLYKLGMQRSGAGLFGGLLGIPFVAALGSTGAKIVIILALFVAIMILTGTSLVQLFRAITKPADMVASNISSVYEQRAIERARKENSYIDIPLDKEDVTQRITKAKSKKGKNEKLDQLEKVFGVKEPVVEKVESNPVSVPGSGEKTEPSAAVLEAVKNSAAKPEEKKPPVGASMQMTMFADEPPQDGSYHFPPITMLETTKVTNDQEIAEELKTNGRMLVETLKSFGVQTKIMDISRGPAVTRYELQPAAGVKISKITNLSDDIAMNLAASGVRIEAPIPGKAAVGIEVPNKKVSVVRMRELIESNSFCTAKSRLTVVLGRDIAGEVATADLAKMPHLLIAGSTGSGKSVCINSFIMSLLYKSTPEEVRFLMIDPKVVELGIYNGIPQLLVPVVTDPRKAAGALGWAVTEMLKRYKTFAEKNVRDLNGYNTLAASSGYKDENGQPMPHLPQIVIIIDELADLMMAAPNEVEDSICRLAQMARAAGMHLLIATQRPSVDVITGIIKANIPSRIAFAVSSQVDSRTILDMGGAEKLLGRGDMLFSPVGSQKPIRIQGCFVSDSEIESVVNFVKKTQEAGYDKDIAEEIEKNAVAEKDSGSDSALGEDTDPMMPDAVKCVVEAGQASTSLLQRRLRLGYARAGRLIDEMEQMGIVGPHEGSKPRQVLITYQQWLEMTMQQADQKESEE